ILAVQAMLKDAGFKVPDINMKAYMKVRTLTQKYMDDFLGYYINPKNRVMNSLLIGPGLPGGMMGSLMSDLENNLSSINKWKNKHNQPELTQDDLMIKLFEEVTYVWPKIGYPPLVTPFSQYVKNLALMNVIQLEKGKERWSMIADNVWDMIIGKTGKLPGEPAPEIVEMAKEKGLEFYTGNPQDLYPDQLDEYRAEMKKRNWDTGQDDEELLEFAMHPEQYKAYKSGDAKKSFEADLANRKAEETASETVKTTAPVSEGNGYQPKTLVINIDNEEYVVNISYPENGNGGTAQPAAPAQVTAPVAAHATAATPATGNVKEVLSPLEGKFFLTKEPGETALKVGDSVRKNDIVGYIESMKTYNAIASEYDGTVIEICYANGESVEEDDILIKLQ
ncbi:MAG: oxaloacetate decarboxylase, partial [Fermentimonas sp.]|nr:oxaloacetate decarboxylase [Fermentimonas sp.]